ncbi:MAG: hypothetical protein KF693_19485, partial [Nitrospira sp.]|nr:hypothetical protein [Nitrospira sp.]
MFAVMKHDLICSTSTGPRFGRSRATGISAFSAEWYQKRLPVHYFRLDEKAQELWDAYTRTKE